MSGPTAASLLFRLRWCVSVTCPSNAATLAVLIMQPLCPSTSGSFFPISPTARRITLKVPAMFTCRKRTKTTDSLQSYEVSPAFSSSAVCPSYIDDTLKVLQTVRGVFLKVVSLDSYSDARAVDCQVQLTKLLSGQGHCGLHICLRRHLGNINKFLFQPHNSLIGFLYEDFIRVLSHL